jgi:hypothetical protein
MNLLVGIIAFISEYLDSGLGMGYGTALAPILIIMGYEPLRVVPAILISQLVTDITACVFHHRLKNVDLRVGTEDFKSASVLGGLGSVGVIMAVVIALKIPKHILSLYIGFLVLVMGGIVLVTIKRPMRFSWPRLMGISLLASFNKGISGGGYGPLVMGGQMLAGIHVKNAVGITAFSEAVICLVGFIIYLVSGKTIDWKLVTTLVVFATAAVPLAALTVKKAPSDRLKAYVGILMVVLGLFTIFKISSGS